MSDQTVFVGRTKRVTPLTDAELNYSPEEWAEALAEDPSCIRAYLEAAEERGRRSGVEAKDAAYAERNQCVALIVRMALAHGWRAGVRDHEDKPGEAWEADWRNLVCIDLPTGQVSWHFHDSEKHLLAGLPQYPASWDGHDTAEKYRRVNAALAANRRGDLRRCALVRPVDPEPVESPMTPPDSGEREVQHVVAAAFEYCRVDGEVAVHVPLPLAQRILAALEVTAWRLDYSAPREDASDLARSVAAELRARLPR